MFFFDKRKSLFVFDNAEKSDYLAKFLPLHSLPPGANKPYILITSRINGEVWERLGVIEGVELDVLAEEETTNFVREVLKDYLNTMDDSQDEMIRQLAVDTLHRFPLALQQAVAYIR